jgi:hypothetical protein
MIRGDSSEYELLERWTKGFDCQGYKSCEIGVREDLGQRLSWIMLLITIFTLALIHMQI